MSDLFNSNFRKANFPDATLQEWQDYRWQFANVIDKAKSNKPKRPFVVTPYLAAVFDGLGENHPVTREFVPSVDEDLDNSGEADPLAEQKYEVNKILVHKYPDRVLLLVSSVCGAYCRYCTRSRLTSFCPSVFNMVLFNEALEYIKNNPQIRDVLISGGDPLMMDDEFLDGILAKIRSIAHVEIVRIGTRMPGVMPFRVTDNLVAILKKHQPLFVSIHFSRSEEITEEVEAGLRKLADSGLVLLSQTVLLKNINDEPQVLADLFKKLAKNRVIPYYLYHCDPVRGSAHFRTSIQKGLEIMGELTGSVSGYLIPKYVADTKEGGKVILSPQNIKEFKNGEVILRGYNGKDVSYPDL